MGKRLTAQQKLERATGAVCNAILAYRAEAMDESALQIVLQDLKREKERLKEGKS